MIKYIKVDDLKQHASLSVQYERNLTGSFLSISQRAKHSSGTGNTYLRQAFMKTNTTNAVNVAQS